MNIRQCIARGFLQIKDPDNELSNKELKESEYDFSSARIAFSNQDYKWCIVKCYYSMFHAAKSILFSLGYFEKRHIAIIVVLEDLCERGKLESKYLIDFKASMSAREDADYHYSYSKETAEYDLDITARFNKEMKYLIEKNKQINP